MKQLPTIYSRFNWLALAFFLCCNSLLYSQSNPVDSSTNSTATASKFGLGLALGYNLYSWYQKPSTIEAPVRNVGQALNLLPNLYGTIWFGNPDKGLFSVEGGVEYLPFALDVSNFGGMGVLNFPISAHYHFPIAQQHSTHLYLDIGAGAQFTLSEAYARPDAFRNSPNPFFFSPFVELSINLGAVGYQQQHVRFLRYFIRAGIGPFQTATFSTGLQLHLWSSL